MMRETPLPAKTFAGLPRTLFPVAGFSAFDTLAFYGLQSVLVYYIYFATNDGGLGFSVETAIAIASAFGACAYLATIIMGWFSDKVLGAGRTLRYGALVASAGYLTLAFLPGAFGLGLGLVMITIGAASMWVGESSVIGGTLDRYPLRRDAGFTIYYVGGASGSFIGIMLSGLLQESVGFSIGFVISAVLILIGLTVYLPFRKLSEATAPKVDSDHRATTGSVVGVSALVLAGAAVLVISVGAGFNPATIIGIAALFIATLMIIKLLRDSDIEDKSRQAVIGYIPFFVATIVFNGLYQQLYTTVAVFSDESTDRSFLGIEMPPSIFLGFAPLCSILVAPALAGLWIKLGPRQPRLSSKYGIGFLGTGVAMAALAASAATPGMTPMLVLVLIVIAFGVADVMLTPAGLALASRVAPPTYASRMIAIHYLAIAGGIALAGTAGPLFSQEDSSASLYFGLCALISLLVAGAIVLLPRLIASRNRLTKSEPESAEERTLN